MIELVLHNPAEHIEIIVVALGLAWNLFVQAGVGKGSDRFDELIVSILRKLNRLTPSCFAGVFHWRKVLLIAEGYGCATSAAADSIIPGSNVQKKFPDGVSVFDRTGSRGLGVHVSKKFTKRIAMPGVSFECTANLVSEADSFSHGELHKRCRLVDFVGRTNDTKYAGYH